MSMHIYDGLFRALYTLCGRTFVRQCYPFLIFDVWRDLAISEQIPHECQIHPNRLVSPPPTTMSYQKSSWKGRNIITAFYILDIINRRFSERGLFFCSGYSYLINFLMIINFVHLFCSFSRQFDSYVIFFVFLLHFCEYFF